MKKMCFILGCALLLLNACKKENNETPPANLSNTSNGTLNDFYVSNSKAPQVYTVTASAAFSMECSQGTRITIPANAFMTKSGSIVTGTVEFSVTELYTKKDLILNRAQTTTSSSILVSAAALKITARQNSNELKLYPGKKLSILVPAGSNPVNNMQVFYGVTDQTSGDLMWTAASNSLNAPAVPDTGNLVNPFYYSFVSDSLNWINCDYFYSSQQPKTPVTITVHGNYNASNTSVLLVFDDIRSVAKLHGSNQSFTQSYTIPVGMKVTIVAIARINGKYYASYTNSVIAVNHLQDLNLSETTESDILTRLSSL